MLMIFLQKGIRFSYIQWNGWVINMFIVVILVLLLVVSLLMKESALFNTLVKAIVVLYYIVITAIFINGYHRIHEKYNMYDGPVIPEGWSVSSDWAFSFSFAFIIPVWLLVLYVLFKKMKPLEIKKRWADFIIAFMLSNVVSFVLFVIFNLAYGMSP